MEYILKLLEGLDFSDLRMHVLPLIKFLLISFS